MQALTGSMVSNQIAVKFDHGPHHYKVSSEIGMLFIK